MGGRTTFNKIVVQPLSPLPFIRNFVASTYFNLFGGRGDGKTIRRQFRGDRIRLEIVDRTFPRSSSWKGRQGFSVNVITLHTCKPARTILCENAFRGKSSFHRRCLPCDWDSSAYVHTVRRPEKLKTKTFLLANLLKNRLTLFPLPFELNHCFFFFFFFSHIVRIFFFFYRIFISQRFDI